MSPPPDVWGAVYVDHWEGRIAPHTIERDDGREHEFESAEGYFLAPRSDSEARLLESLDGPVLDLGAGPGSYALYLQEKGLTVTAADVSDGALRVCRERGCRDARVMDIRTLRLEPDSYRSIIIMGNTIGAHQTPETLPGYLAMLRRGVGDGGRLLLTMMDPLDTDNPIHLQYHDRNRAAGRPPGLTRIRIKYRDLVDDWIDLWLITRDEMETAAARAGWSMMEEESFGPHRVRLFEAQPEGADQ